MGRDCDSDKIRHKNQKSILFLRRLRESLSAEMIKVTSSADGLHLNFRATLRGLAIYLDNWAIYDLAEHDPLRRRRFVAGVCSGVADLLLSVTNVAELAGPQGNSFDAVKKFLNALGPNWFPLELNIFSVLEREQRGKVPPDSCIAEEFMTAYFQNRNSGCLPGTGKVIDLTQSFYGLGSVLDWMAHRRKWFLDKSGEFDTRLAEAVYRARKLKRVPRTDSAFDSARPASFTSTHLIKALIAESGKVKDGDGLDFFHAVMASSFASYAALDKHWKRRVEGLPKPNQLARIYSATELDTMVTDIEHFVNECRSKGVLD